MVGCPRGVFAVIMSRRVAELRRGAIRELEVGGRRKGWGEGEGPTVITHLGRSCFGAQGRDTAVTQHQKYEDEADLWVDQVKPCAHSTATFDAERSVRLG